MYAIVDHTRCLAYMLGDCIVPSNVREGYLVRLVLRRTLRMMNELGIKESLAELIEQQMRIIGTQSFEQDMLISCMRYRRNGKEREQRHYAEGHQDCPGIARNYKNKRERVPLKEV